MLFNNATMTYKDFEIESVKCRLYEDWVFMTMHPSWEWVKMTPHYITVKWKLFPRYSILIYRYDWTCYNSELKKKYDADLERFHSVVIENKKKWELLSRNLSDLIEPEYPNYVSEWTRKRIFIYHTSLVLKYWYGIDSAWWTFVDSDPYNLSVHNVASHYAKKISYLRTPTLTFSQVDRILSLAWRYSTDYIAAWLGISDGIVSRVILWYGVYAHIGDRHKYRAGIMDSRWCYHGMRYFSWETYIDLINRTLCEWSNYYRYEKYCSAGEVKWKRRTNWRMGYGAWVVKYWRSEEVAKALLKKWIDLNIEFIDNGEEMKKYIDDWSLWGDRCWNLERFRIYITVNAFRMPPKVRKKKGIPCIIPDVVVREDSVKIPTLYDISDWEFMNLYDYVMWDFTSTPIEDIRLFLSSLEDEPVWEDYEANWYMTVEEFKDSYLSLLGGSSLKELKELHKETLLGILL